MRILVTRPVEDCVDIARLLAAMGHEALLAPLLAVKLQDGPPLLLEGVQAVLATSANGVRALARRSDRRDLAIFAVGPQTAEAAAQAGFVRIRSAEGDAAALAAAVPGWADPRAGALLHVAGENGSGALADALTVKGFQVQREILYRVEPARHLPDVVIHAIQENAVQAALFFSPQSAQIFADCAARAGVSTARLLAICISANTAHALQSLAFAEIRVAAAPNQVALLARL